MGTSGAAIRRVTADDFGAVTALLAELGRPALDPRTAAATRRVYLAHVADPDVGSLLAERDGAAAGFLSLHFLPRLNHATPAAWIPDLIVTERARGNGIATALLAAAVAAARGRGCHRLTLESGYARKRAHRFYEREGMTDAGKYFVLELAGENGP